VSNEEYISVLKEYMFILKPKPHIVEKYREKNVSVQKSHYLKKTS